MKAILTADIVGYSKLSYSESDILIKKIHEVFQDSQSVRTNISSLRIFRGDSIQIEIKDISKALLMALTLRSLVNKTFCEAGKKSLPYVNVRIAIGIGSVQSPRNLVNESSGDAYTRSGRSLDTMKNNKRFIVVKTGNPAIDTELNTELMLLEFILAGWTANSAEVVFWALQGCNETEIAKILGKSQPAVNQAKKRAGWSGIEVLLNRFEMLVHNIAS